MCAPSGRNCCLLFFRYSAALPYSLAVISCLSLLVYLTWIAYCIAPSLLPQCHPHTDSCLLNKKVLPTPHPSSSFLLFLLVYVCLPTFQPPMMHMTLPLALFSACCSGFFLLHWLELTTWGTSFWLGLIVCLSGLSVMEEFPSQWQWTQFGWYYLESEAGMAWITKKLGNLVTWRVLSAFWEEPLKPVSPTSS